MYHKKLTFLQKIVPITILIILYSTFGFAQTYNTNTGFKSYWQINVSGGTSLFFGDIKQYKIWPVSSNENEWRFGAGVQLVKQISPVFGIRGQALYGQLSGTRRDWNKYFESNYVEFNLNTTISIRNIISSYQPNQFWDAYLVLGIGITNYNTELKDLSTKKVIRKVGYGNGKSFGGRTLQGIVTGGIGFNFRINDHFNVNVESVNRAMNSDDMDGWVGGFKYDIYNYSSIGISYKFGAKKSSKKSENYDYFKNDNKEIKEAEYDEYDTDLVEPPAVDALVIEPSVVKTPDYTITEKKPAKEPEVIEEVTVDTQPEVVVVETVTPDLEYRVQIAAKYGRELAKQYLSNTYNININDIKEDRFNNYYIYTIGSFETYDQARDKRNLIRSQGISDAFVVAFKNGRRLSKLPPQ